MACHNLPVDSEKYSSEIKQVQLLWQNYEKCRGIETILEECFSSAENPFVAALCLMASADDFLLCKKASLAFYIMETFKCWLDNQEKDLKPLLTADVKLNSYFLVHQQKNLWLIKLVAEVYCLADDNEMFLPFIQEQLTALKFKQACESVAILKLHRHFTIKDFVIQLILQDKLTVVEDFLKDSPEHQREIVEFMDNLLGNGKEPDVIERIQSLVKELNVKDAKLVKYKPKSLSKLIARYVKTYEVSSDVCPNYTYIHKKKVLGFMIAKRFIEKSSEGESWEEMMIDHIKDSPDLQLKLVDILIDYGEPEEAYRWFRYFNLDIEKLPSNLLRFSRDYDQKLNKEGEMENSAVMEESWDDDPQPSCAFKPTIYSASNSGKKSKKKTYYCDDAIDDEWDMETSSGTTTFRQSDINDDDGVCDEEVIDGVRSMRFEEQVVRPVPDVISSGEVKEFDDSNLRTVDYHPLALNESDIIIVDEPNGFKHLMEDLREGVDVIGVDCEWKPSFTPQKNSVALMQLATWNKIYLLDILALSDSDHCAQCWVDFNMHVLENERIIKLGFDINADKSMVLVSLPTLRGFAGSSFLDLSSLWHVLVNNHSLKFPFDAMKGESSKGLSQLVYLCFGKTLAKSDQFSNWEKRPLRRSQKMYAALDAFCLLEVYDFLKKSCFEQNIEFEEVVASSMRCSKPSPGKKSKGKGKKKKERKLFNPMSLIGVQNLEAASQYPPIRPNSLRVVCDTMVQGLGKKLRSCGVDSWILQASEGPDMCVKIALAERRIILTRGNNYRRYLNYVDAADCYAVQNDPLEDQVKEVLGHFNVVLKEEDIFSRCQICNGKEFAEIHNSLMKYIVSLVTGVKPMVLESSGSNGMGEAKRNTGRGRRWSYHSVKPLKETTALTHWGVHIKCHTIPTDVLLNIEYFYACEKCGKVYWDGSHWQNELSRKKEHNLLD